MYAYVRGNPASETDPSGLCPETCLSGFNNSFIGGAVNFLSFASPLLGPDRTQSAIEDVGGTTLKWLAYQGLRSVNAMQIVGATDWDMAVLIELLARDVAFGIQTVAKELVFPVALGATIIQEYTHVYCDFQ
jgi:hypothetical protein